MSQRKLQQDIDKLLKKVKEGLEDFDLIYDKFQTTDPSNTSHREKLEADLKKEIKKLQKHRDQIKTWLSKEDVKDKRNVLMENRRLIEIGMETFKSVEKLMKTKQFSKEALTNPDIVKDPKELKKHNQCLFIQDCIEELQKQLESHEAQEDEHQIERHEFHITNLENVLKLLQNNGIDADTIEEYHEDIRYYVDNNEDPDFIEYDTLYEDMGCNMDKVDESIAQNDNIEDNDSTSKSGDPFSANEEHMLESRANDKSASSGIPIDRSPLKKMGPNKLSSSNFEESATAGLRSSRSTSNEKKAHETMKEIIQPETSESVRNLSFPPDRTEEINEAIKRDIENNGAFQNPLFGDELTYWIESKRNLLQPYKIMPPEMVSQLELSLLNCPDSLDADSPCLYRKPLSQGHPTSVYFPSEPIRFVYPYEPITIASDASNNKNTGLNGQTNSNNSETPDNLLGSISGDVAQESKRKSSNEIGKEAKRNQPDIYSRTSLAKVFTKFDLDTLFFIFYHYQGHYEQFLAARELATNRNWKFNKVDRCWYYKEMEKLPPGINTNSDKKEEESWRYFDYKKSWLARRCGNDFVYREENFERL